MSQNPLVDTTTSGVQSSKIAGLKPALAAALASLEVQLDQELARYRRTRTVYRTTSSPSMGSSTSSKPQLNAISTTEGKKLPVEERGDAQQKFKAATANAATANALNKEVSLPEIKTSTPSTSVPETQQKLPAPATAPEVFQATTLESTALPVVPVFSKTESEHPLKESTPVDAKTQTTPTPNASIVAVDVKEHKSEKLIESDNSHTQHGSRHKSGDPPTAQPPDDYLESSEALLRSLAEEQPKTHKQTNSDSLLSPLGIGSILLLLVASLTMGYVLFNPKTIQQFSLNGLFKRNAPLSAENTESAEKNIKTVAQPLLTPIPKYPNLATDEFPEVRDPNDVVGLKPKAKLTPTVSPNPVAAQNPINPVTTVQKTQPAQPYSSPQTPTTITSQKPLSDQQLPDAQIKPSSDGFYHVVTDNQDDRTLASARQVVPDAYLSSDGKFVYLGAVKNKEKAQQLLQQLQAKGIKVRIHTP